MMEERCEMGIPRIDASFASHVHGQTDPGILELVPVTESIFFFCLSLAMCIFGHVLGFLFGLRCKFGSQ